MLFANAAGEVFIPGIMQVYREPTNPEAWGRTAFDVALLALPVGKLGQASKAAGNLGRVALEGVAVGRILGGEEIIGGAYNVALHEMYKGSLRIQMSKPCVTDPGLNRILDYAYRPNAKVRSGSTAASL